MSKRAIRFFLIFFVVIIASQARVSTAYASSDGAVFLGGFPITVEIENTGAIVTGTRYDENNFPYSMLKNSMLNKGDVIIELAGAPVQSIIDVDAIMSGNTDGHIMPMKYKRGTNICSADILPIKEECSGKYKLGYWLKDKIFGLGTVSFVMGNGVFASLGHSVVDDETGVQFVCARGSVYECKLVGVEKGKSGVPGKLKGKCINCMYPKGSLYSNENVGLFGKFQTEMPEMQKYEIASSSEVKMGAAKICSTIDSGSHMFDIEIVRTFKQQHPSEKGMVIKVTDKDLLAATGGIVQGMSGSPIIQNGKIIGAVTHVFTNNPAMGYAVYSEWMLERARTFN